jgi:putative ABC transport system permease protein
VAVAAGVVALRLWRGSGSGWGVGLAAAVTVVLGATAVAPVLVAQAEPLAGRLRRGARLAARGLARQRLRSGAVVAAVMAPVGVTVLVACAVVTDEARERATWESSDDSQSPGDNEVLYLANGASPEDAEATVAAIREIVPDAEEGPVLAAVTPDAPPDAGFAAAVRVQVEGDDAGGYERYVIVTSPDYLDSAGAGRHALDVFEDGGVVVPGTLTPTYGADRGSRPPRADERVPVVGADVELHGDQVAVEPALRTPSSGSIVFVSRDTAERWGAEIVEIGAFFVASEPLTDEQADALMDVGTTDNDTWARQYLTAGEPNGPGQVQTGAWQSEYRDESMIARVAAVGASLLVTLAVVAVALALTAAESSDENRLLEAIGSPPSIRRSVSAWQALLLPAMAVTLAVPIALVVAAALLGDDGGGTRTGPSHVIVPWLTVAAVVVLLPLASGAVTWVGATVTGRRRHDLAAAVAGGD